MKSYIRGGLAALIVAAIGITHASRDGSGNYSLPAGNPVTTNTTISSTWANSTLSDIASALTQSLSKDGQTVPTANLPMGSFKHTNVADATSRNQYAAAGQVQDFALQTIGSVSGTNTITGSLTPAITSYVDGMIVTFEPAAANTGAATIAINGLSASSIVKADGDALAAGDLALGVVAVLVRDDSTFVLLNPQTGIAHVHSAADVTSGTLAVARGGTGTTTSTGTGNVVLSASPTLSGTITGGTVSGTHSGSGASLTSLNASNLSSGTVADARISSSSVTQHMDDGYARNITGKAGTTKTLSTSAPSGGSDGDIWYRY